MQTYNTEKKNNNSVASSKAYSKQYKQMLKQEIQNENKEKLNIEVKGGD